MYLKYDGYIIRKTSKSYCSINVNNRNKNIQKFYDRKNVNSLPIFQRKVSKSNFYLIS